MLESIPVEDREWAARCLEQFDESLIGRIASPKPVEDCAVLRHFNRKCVHGNYLEIGVLWGASLIVAGLSKQGQLFGIDPLEGWYGEGKSDPFVDTDHIPNEEVVRVNIDAFGLTHRTTLFAQKHPPFPDELDDVPFEIAFIDGDHRRAGVTEDWIALKDRVSRFIVFHDLHHRNGPPVVFEEAADDPDWKVAWNGIEEDYSVMGVLERVEW